MASEQQSSTGEAAMPERRPSSSLSFVEVENKVAHLEQGSEPLSPPPTALSDGSSLSTIDSMSSISVLTEKALPDAGVPDPHETFYFKDGNVVFLVEHHLYKVHQLFFDRDSERFRTLLAEQRPASCCGSDSEAIFLPDVKSIDFEHFLAILYPRYFDVCSLTTRDQWASVLHIASEFGFDSIRRLAVRSLFPLASSIDRIVFGHRYHIPEWLLDAYVEVCTRHESITAIEGKALGVEDVVHISAIREAIARGFAPLQLRLEIWRSCCPSVVDVDVRNALKVEKKESSGPIDAVRLEIEQKAAVVNQLCKRAEQAQAALLDSESRLDQLIAQEAQKQKAKTEVERRQKEKERRLAAAEVAHRLAQEEAKLIAAAKKAGNAVAAARLELERAERVDAEARRAAEKLEACRAAEEAEARQAAEEAEARRVAVEEAEARRAAEEAEAYRAAEEAEARRAAEEAEAHRVAEEIEAHRAAEAEAGRGRAGAESLSTQEEANRLAEGRQQPLEQGGTQHGQGLRARELTEEGPEALRNSAAHAPTQATSVFGSASKSDAGDDWFVPRPKLPVRKPAASVASATSQRRMPTNHGWFASMAESIKSAVGDIDLEAPPTPASTSRGKVSGTTPHKKLAEMKGAGKHRLAKEEGVADASAKDDQDDNDPWRHGN